MNTATTQQETSFTSNKDNIEANAENLHTQTEKSSLQQYIDMVEDMSSCYVLGYN